ncbi:unnamed protein product [Darwinula stevensoni]|uniref:Uncharacterized protein n=1 Tax=Darwinula stevensoni TaxID=69355 RepID=A0A7R8X7T7_9CRUS|nr:unnamed protein product [Darwinula stevensoni]CAG0887231.1 unnamed protein product [Darwinula stevensoni]
MELHRAAENSALIRSAYKNIVKGSRTYQVLNNLINLGEEAVEEFLSVAREIEKEEPGRVAKIAILSAEAWESSHQKKRLLGEENLKHVKSGSDFKHLEKKLEEVIQKKQLLQYFISVRWIRVEDLPAQLKLLSLVDLEFGLDPRSSSQDIDQEQDSVLLTVRRLLKRDSTCIILQEMGGTQETLETRNVAFLRNQERTHIRGSWFWMDAHNPAVIISLEKLLAGEPGSDSALFTFNTKSVAPRSEKSEGTLQSGDFDDDDDAFIAPVVTEIDKWINL